MCVIANVLLYRFLHKYAIFVVGFLVCRALMSALCPYVSKVYLFSLLLEGKLFLCANMSV